MKALLLSFIFKRKVSNKNNCKFFIVIIIIKLLIEVIIKLIYLPFLYLYIWIVSELRFLNTKVNCCHGALLLCRSGGVGVGERLLLRLSLFRFLRCRRAKCYTLWEYKNGASARAEGCWGRPAAAGAARGRFLGRRRRKPPPPRYWAKEKSSFARLSPRLHLLCLPSLALFSPRTPPAPSRQRTPSCRRAASWPIISHIENFNKTAIPAHPLESK